MDGLRRHAKVGVIARGIAAASLLLASGPAGAASSLAPHHAVYDLALSGSPDGATVAATGRMTFELREDCDAWATEQTLTLDATDRTGHQTATRSDYATYETKDGRTLTFSMTQHDGSHAADTVRGVATRGPASVIARFSSPAGLVRTLPADTLFPMAHNAAIIAAAGAGQHAIAPVLFDGTSADGAQATYASILSWAPTGVSAPAPALAALDSGRVHIAFFPEGSHAMAPDYELGMRFFANGVSDRLDMDFGDFSMHGDLAGLHLLPVAQNCEAARGK